MALCFSTRFSESLGLLVVIAPEKAAARAPARRPLFLASFSSSLSNLGVEGRPGLGRRALPGKARARSPQDKKRRRAGGTRGVRPIRSCLSVWLCEGRKGEWSVEMAERAWVVLALLGAVQLLRLPLAGEFLLVFD